MRKKIIQFLIQIRKFLREKFHQYNSQLPFIIAIIIALLIVVFGINFFIEFTSALKSTMVESFDQRVTQYIISFRSPQLNVFFQYLTEVGDFYGYLVLAAVFTIVFYLIFRNWRYVLEMVFVLLISGLANVSLKQVINRARPDAVHLVSVETLSYPSGHAMSAMAFYGFLIYLFYSLKLKLWIKVLSIIICSLIILGIGISRVYLGVHFPSDVLGGFIAGFIWVIFCVVLFHLIDLLRKRRRRNKKTSTKSV